jgi:hypothetical protein
LTTQTTFCRDDAISVINSLIIAIKTDFSGAFAVKFPTEADLKNYKNRIYTLLKKDHTEYTIPALVDSYENYIMTGAKYLPNPPDIYAMTKEQEKKLRKEASKIKEAEELARLPSTTHSVNPLKMLSTAKTAVEANDHTDWLERKALALKNHEAVIAIAKAKGTVRKGQHEQQHYCKFPGCSRLGAISSGTKGGDNFYCSEHWVRL